MFFPEGAVRVHVYGRPVDMRKSFEALGKVDGNIRHLDHVRTRSNTRPKNQKFSTPAHSA